jgi:cysteine desulfurase/selenocysteine lyase
MNQPAAAVTTPLLDVHRVREDFPALAQSVHGKPLVYFDNAATGQRPQAVLDATNAYYAGYNANVHRGVHSLGERATLAFEGARAAMAKFINAPSQREVVWVRGVTEAVNLVAQSFARPRLAPGDKILLTHMEHHSNIVPWQLVCEQTGAEIVVAPVNDDGELDLDAFKGLLDERVKMAAFMHVSNALGTINPVVEMTRACKRFDIPVLIDGAQAAPHEAIDVQAIGCDFYCISGHKMYGPTGIGVLYGRESVLESMPPYHGGGEMIDHVSFEKTTYAGLPGKFEAGTPNIAGAIGLGAAAEYLNGLGLDAVAATEQALLAYATDRFAAIDGMRRIGTAKNKTAVLSFLMNDVHAHDLGTLLDHYGIAIRTGHHCAMPLMARFGVPATSRVSLAFYNTREEIDTFVESLETVRKMFA